MIQKRELKAFAEPLGLADHGGGRVLQPSPDEVRGPIVEEHVAAVEERRITMPSSSRKTTSAFDGVESANESCGPGMTRSCPELDTISKDMCSGKLQLPAVSLALVSSWPVRRECFCGGLRWQEFRIAFDLSEAQLVL